MKFLLDTCAFVWLVSAPKRLGPVASAAIDGAEARLYLSDASVWEICLKWQAKKIKLPQPPRLWIQQQQAAWEIESLPIDRSHLFRVTELAEHHRDPFDRLLVAQAIEASLTLLTPDPAIASYPVATLW